MSAPRHSALLLIVALCPTTALLPADPEERKPIAGARPSVVYRWKSKNDLRYTWVLPKTYGKGAGTSLTVILHGTGLDYRWGHANHPVGVFRPNDVVVSVDGTSPGANGSRLFLGQRGDAEAFRDFLREMRETFEVERVFLYGHSQGGFFVVYFAGEFPDEVDGVVAHASGAWNWSKTGKPVHRVAIAFMHGTSDPVVPYRQSVGARDVYVRKEFPLVHLRRLARYNHWPNAVRAGEVLAWCEGMTTDRPDVALNAVRDMLAKKPPDEYSWETTVDYAGARAVLRRFEGAGPRPFPKLSRSIVSAARREISRIEKEGQKHAKALGRSLGRSKPLRLDGRPWLGHLVSIREDFRGVESVEKVIRATGFDELAQKHSVAAGRILEAWYADEAPPADVYRAVVRELPSAFLCEEFPPSLAEKMKEWHGAAASHGLSREDVAAYRAVEAWKTGWDTGLDAYRAIWKAWK